MYMIFMMLFPIIHSPIPLVMVLFLTSLTVFFSMLFFSSWYSYILFLVYIGGLLVLFIYVCMFSSNDKIFSKFPNIIYILLICMLFNDNFYSFISFEASVNMNSSLFIMLVFVLLLGFLGVLRVLGNKSSIIMNEK
uniref:NADH dehydrogenase subunit 6 n=1 Tax=Ferrissia californica TaxID=1776375 RepID=UPI00315D87A2